jgi:hypothetical protein
VWVRVPLSAPGAGSCASRYHPAGRAHLRRGARGVHAAESSVGGEVDGRWVEDPAHEFCRPKIGITSCRWSASGEPRDRLSDALRLSRLAGRRLKMLVAAQRTILRSSMRSAIRNAATRSGQIRKWSDTLFRAASVKSGSADGCRVRPGGVAVLGRASARPSDRALPRRKIRRSAEPDFTLAALRAVCNSSQEVIEHRYGEGDVSMCRAVDHALLNDGRSAWGQSLDVHAKFVGNVS